MTSKENNKQTVDFLQKHQYFGYPKDFVGIFEQEELPLLDIQGKLLMGENMLIKEASNGNGGLFSSMAKKGVLEDMHAREIDWVFVGGVDNILLKLVDLPLMGLCIKRSTPIGSRTVLKTDPKENVGVFCKQDGKPKIIEYTEMPEEVASMVNEHGELIFGETNITAMLFSIDAVTTASTQRMPYHVAHKISGFVEQNGKFIYPTQPNCYKFEKFIFDAFALFEDISLLRGVREEDFAPIKNATGNDSPETAKKLYEEYFKNIL